MNYVNSYNFYEGFDGSGNTVDTSGNSIISDNIAIDKAKRNILTQKINMLQQKQNAAAPTSTAAATTSTTAATTSTAATPTSTTAATTPSGTEGFCMSDRETNMLKGKPSNAIPVFNTSRDQSDYVSPSDKSVFTGSYSSF
jgi:hypothetical protein